VAWVLRFACGGDLGKSPWAEFLMIHSSSNNCTVIGQSPCTVDVEVMLSGRFIIETIFCDSRIICIPRLMLIFWDLHSLLYCAMPRAICTPHDPKSHWVACPA
jgi:hypothetical protein